MYLVLVVGHLQIIHHVHILDDAHLLFLRGEPSLVVIVEIVGERVGDIIVQVEVAGVRAPHAVRCLMVQQQTERLRLVALVAQPVERQVGDDVRDVALPLNSLAVVNECRVVVVSLACENIPVVEARRIARQVPFPHHAGLIAGFLQQFGEGLLAAVKGARVVGEPVLMTVLAREQAGSRRSRERVGHEALGKPHAMVGYPVDVGGLSKSVVVSADGLVRMVVTHDVDDVHRLFLTVSMAVTVGCVGHRRCYRHACKR